MKVLVFEHVSGGGEAANADAGPLLPSGLAMLQAVVQGLRTDGIEVLTTLDHRIAAAVPLAQRITPADDLHEALARLARKADRALVIAPCDHDQLSQWLTWFEGLGVATVNARAPTARLCCDKLLMAEALAAAGVPTPPTRLVGDPPVLPCVVKPRWGDGCERTWKVEDIAAWQALRPRLGTGMVVQPWTPGQAASCSVLVRDHGATALPAGRQRLRRDRATGLLAYRGGVMPWRCRATELALRAVAALPGLYGYVGVDVVLGDNMADDRVIEVNPRLTMSFLGHLALAGGGGWLVDESIAPRFSADSAVCWNSIGRLRFRRFRCGG